MAHHPVIVGAPRGLRRSLQPWLLQRTDDDFIPATLDDLRSPAGEDRLRALRAQASDGSGHLKLFQPIQRQFHLALVEAWCDTPGEPRIAPARVQAAGMVLRRIGAGDRPEGWMRSKGRIRGWLPLARVGGADADPAAARRADRQWTGVADIDRQLAGFRREDADSLLEEDVIPLYVAPPDVCADAGRTLYYGNVPTVSGEIGEADADFGAAPGVDFGPRSQAFRDHLVEGLRGEAMDLPRVGERLAASWLADSEQAGADLKLRRFVLLLRQLASEFDAFAAPTHPALQALQRLQLPLKQRNVNQQRETVRADTFLLAAQRIVLRGEAADAPEMPESWPAMDGRTAGELADALHAAMRARFVAMKAKAGRFDEPQARYQLRAFVRLKPEGPCPARIVWSEPSDAFVIAAWYEGAGAPPVQIALPDPSDRNLLAALKPNVAFVVPPSLQSLLSGSTKDLLAGGGKSSSLGLTWICGFNIPIITICAFLVLNIFLTLFNLVFGWLFSMKICLPFPKIPPKG
ncbi:hypothetical protein [Ramlibacter alkalitolerans]|uniref:IcmF-related N-terminal domain-containing protein n=1 Tax=Ramlibacter alkalitolerans TaxID=2039631 RepID=A0ABS1JIF0_9BURK|nr:hypothetical protein [Ramlibacter alkalitolerans]MBL0423998.1 hypothetical protein [Ramlibacter alkalitolerans]